MSWGETWRAVEILLTDPASQLGAAVAGWQYPVSRGELTLRDLYDLQHQIAVRQSGKKTKPKPYPRPSDPPPKHIGRGMSLTVAEYEAIKASMTVAPKQPRDERGRFIPTEGR